MAISVAKIAKDCKRLGSGLVSCASNTKDLNLLLPNFNFQLGALASALEYAVPEQMFVTEENPGEAVSAVKALQKAAQQGQRIYHIIQENQAEALPNIRQNSLTMQEIRSALAVGKEVIVHTDPISVPGWTGAGYVIFDPDVGDGAWKIGGGTNGGWSDISSTIADIFVYLHVEIDQGLLKLSKLASKLTAVGTFASAVGAFLELKDDCGVGASMAIAAVLTVFNSMVSTLALAVAFASAATLIVGMLIVVLVSALLHFINWAIIDAATGVCRLVVTEFPRYAWAERPVRTMHESKETLVS